MFSVFGPLLLLSVVVPAATQTNVPPVSTPIQIEASGTFGVSVTPNTSLKGPIGLVAINKTYHGRLEATGSGQMLGLGDPSSGGSASYVALEQVSGVLDGRKGGFTLQHLGWMDGERRSLSAGIVPGSGTGALAGISGGLNITIVAKQHRYQLYYSLPK